MTDPSALAFAKGIAANFVAGDHIFPTGALCWVIEGSWDVKAVRVRARSHGGRWVTRHVATWKLENFRPKTFVVTPHTRWLLGADGSPSPDALVSLAHAFDAYAREERSRRNHRYIERLAGVRDENGHIKVKP